MNVNTKIPNIKKATYFNLTMINNQGSALSTQIWDANGNASAVEGYIWEERKRGESDTTGWVKPFIRAYVHVTATKETYEFDLTGPIGRPEDLGK